MKVGEAKVGPEPFWRTRPTRPAGELGGGGGWSET